MKTKYDGVWRFREKARQDGRVSLKVLLNYNLIFHKLKLRKTQQTAFEILFWQKGYVLFKEAKCGKDFSDFFTPIKNYGKFLCIKKTRFNARF